MSERVETWRARGTFSLSRFCPVHGFPLRLWGRVGKLECPVRACPYIELHDCEQRDGPEYCECRTVQTSFAVPEMADDAAGRGEYDRALAVVHARRHDLVGGADLERESARKNARFVSCLRPRRGQRLFPNAGTMSEGARRRA